MGEYEFIVRFYDTYGSFNVNANDSDEAYTKASDEICNAIMDLPIEVEYEVECISCPEESDDEDE